MFLMPFVCTNITRIIFLRIPLLVAANCTVSFIFCVFLADKILNKMGLKGKWIGCLGDGCGVSRHTLRWSGSHLKHMFLLLYFYEWLSEPRGKHW